MPTKVKAQNQIDEKYLTDTTPHWYILQVYVGFEDAVVKTLQQKIDNLNLHDKILEMYVPVKKVLKMNKKGEKQKKNEKIYPGYIYMKMILDKEVGYVIQNTSYVSRITGTGDFAVALEDGYVEKIKQSLVEQESKQQTSASVNNFQLGDFVQVIEGPFKDMQGKITAIHTKEDKLDVVLTMFDRDTVVTLEVFELKKVLS